MIGPKGSWPTFDPGDLPSEVIDEPDGTLTYVFDDEPPEDLTGLTLAEVRKFVEGFHRKDGTFVKPHWRTYHTGDEGQPVDSIFDALVHEAVGVSESPELRPAVTRAMELIDKVHSLPKDVRKVMLTEKDIDPTGAISGQFNTLHSTIEIDDDPKMFRMATVVHELGHYMDFTGLENFRPRPSDNHPPSHVQTERKLRRALTESDLTQLLFINARALEDRMNYDDSPDLEQAYEAYRYILEPGEVFARVYTQWIALRSGDAELKREVETAPPLYQWPWNDFDDIANEMDRLFRDRGLLK